MSTNLLSQPDLSCGNGQPSPLQRLLAQFNLLFQQGNFDGACAALAGAIMWLEPAAQDEVVTYIQLLARSE